MLSGPMPTTLYSLLWFDVTLVPLIIAVPESPASAIPEPGPRYYVLEMLDMWTDAFATPGTRSDGPRAQKFAIVGPNWKGDLPEGVDMFRSPTAVGWVIGRTQTNGADDYLAVHAFQDGITATPLGGQDKENKLTEANMLGDSPVNRVHAMSAETFFALFADATRHNPPHANDYPILARMKRLGLEPGKPFDLAKAPLPIQEAFRKAPSTAQKKIQEGSAKAGDMVNGWMVLTSPIGSYGSDYLRRAVIAYLGLGANRPEDAVYPIASGLENGVPFDSGQKYLLRFKAGEIPPVRAFWSVTAYNDRQLFAANPIDRYALGDRDDLTYGEDKSLTLYLQRDPPEPDKRSNWLPLPAEGGFSLTMRMYWPTETIIDGSWKPPAVYLQK